MRVATVGDNCIDVYVNRGGVTAVGGQAANVARGLASLGHATAYLGPVGDDAAGQRVLSELRSDGVDVSGVRVLPGATARTTLELTPSGDRIILHEAYGVVEAWAPGGAELGRLGGLDHVHAAWCPALLEAVADLAVPISYDFSAADPAEAALDGLDVAFLSRHRLSADEALEVARRTVARGSRAAVVTMGERGSAAYDGGASVAVPAEPADVVDTCGAGDAYIAAFLDRRLAGEDLEACMRAGARAGAAACEHLGARPGALVP